MCVCVCACVSLRLSTFTSILPVIYLCLSVCLSPWDYLFVYTCLHFTRRNSFCSLNVHMRALNLSGRYICLSTTSRYVCVSDCLRACLPAHMSICLSVYVCLNAHKLSVCLHVFITACLPMSAYISVRHIFYPVGVFVCPLTGTSD